MASRSRIAVCFLLLGIVAGLRSAEAAGRVKLEIFTDERAPITSQQEWLRQLAAAGISNLRIHAGEPTDKVGVEVQGTEADPVYVVTGMITSGNELLLPGGRFRPSDASQVARWLKNLAQKGLQDKEEPRSLFGLTAKQLDRVQHGSRAGQESFAISASSSEFSRRRPFLASTWIHRMTPALSTRM